MPAHGEPLGSLRPAEPLSGCRLGGLEVPLREPLRWLTAPRSDGATAAEGGTADAAEEPAAVAHGGPEQEDELVYVEFAGEQRVKLDAGAAYAFEVRVSRRTRHACTDAPPRDWTRRRRH